MACPDGLLLGFGLPNPLWAATCYLRSDFSQSGIGQGLYGISSGLLISTDEEWSYVLTAGHALYRSDLSRRASVVGIWLGCNGSTQSATRTSSTFFIPTEFPTSGDAPGLDFAVVRITRVDPAVIAPVAISTSSASKAKQVMIVGYPTEGDCAGRRQPYHASLIAKPNGDNYSYDQVTYDGMSGGPLIGRGAQDSGYYCYGVHIRRSDDPTGMQAVRFSSAVVGQITQWLPN